MGSLWVLQIDFSMIVSCRTGFSASPIIVITDLTFLHTKKLALLQRKPILMGSSWSSIFQKLTKLVSFFDTNYFLSNF